MMCLRIPPLLRGAGIGYVASLARVLVMPSPLPGTAGWERVCDLLAADDHEVELVAPPLPRSVRNVLDDLPSLLSNAPEGSRGVFVDREVPPRSGTCGIASRPRLDMARRLSAA